MNDLLKKRISHTNHGIFLKVFDRASLFYPFISLIGQGSKMVKPFENQLGMFPCLFLSLLLITHISDKDLLQ